MSVEPILRIRGLVTSFQTEREIRRAIDGIDIDIYPGRTVGLVGESGSGKSLTSLSILGLVRKPGFIESGSILFQSEVHGQVDLTSLSQEEMRKIRGKEISMIFQEPMTSLNPVYTCGDQVMEVLRLHENMDRKAAQEEVIRLFEQVKLPRPHAIAASYPHQLSGGQKQRVMIAMAIATKPKLLIADEPTTALDVTVQATILDLLKELRDKHNMAILFITHDLGVVASMAHDVVVMNKGKIVEQGTADQILNLPKHPYTKGLLACRPTLTMAKERLLTVSDFTSGVLPVPVRLPITKTNEPLLVVDKVSTRFVYEKTWLGKPTKWVDAVKDISFTIHKGETVGLVGESGCGKTTLGRSILRLVEPTSGTIIFDGKDIRSLDSASMRAMRKDIQVIFQDPYSSLNPRHTVGESIVGPMRVFNMYENEKQREQKAFELLECVGLSAEHFLRFPHEFSGGQRQRVCIARAVALQPKLIICDESVSALDVSVQAQVLNLLNDLKAQFGLTYLFISHDLSVVKYMSDRLIVMRNGSIQEMGEAEEVYSNPSTEYTRELLKAIPSL